MNKKQPDMNQCQMCSDYRQCYELEPCFMCSQLVCKENHICSNHIIKKGKHYYFCFLCNELILNEWLVNNTYEKHLE
jgi:hypothetical protein